MSTGGSVKMSSNSSSQHRLHHAPLYATSIHSATKAALPPLRRAAAFFISRAGLNSTILSQNPRYRELRWQSAFAGDDSRRRLLSSVWVTIPRASSPSTRSVVVSMVKPVIQFVRGVDEIVVPDVSLTRSRDGNTGVATFIFDQPSVFDSSNELGEITGMYLIDEEGVLQSVDVNAKFMNGRPSKIEAKYVMKSPIEWNRFMRFMERYATENNLGFVKK